jgi:hypothetical protein
VAPEPPVDPGVPDVPFVPGAILAAVR